MAGSITQSYHIVQLMKIMNQLRRLAGEGDCDQSFSGMSVPQLACLCYLFYHAEEGGSPVYQRDLETCLKLRRSTISSLLNTLEKKSLIQRIPVSHDARLKQLVLTDAGQALGREVLEHFTGLNQVLVADLDPEEQDTLRSLLDKIECGLASRCP